MTFLRRVTWALCPPFPCTWCCSQLWLLFTALFFHVERTVNREPRKAKPPNNHAWRCQERNFRMCSWVGVMALIINCIVKSSLKSGTMRCGTSLYWGLQLVCLCPHPLEELRNETGAPWGNSYRYSDYEPVLLCGTLFSAGRWTYKPVLDTEYCNITVCIDEMICSKIHHSVIHTSERQGQNMERKKCSSRSPNGVFSSKEPRVFSTD